MKRKRTKKEIVERARRAAENHPNARRLRDLAERGWADLAAQGRVEGPPPAPGKGGERLREIVLRSEARRHGDAPPAK